MNYYDEAVYLNGVRSPGTVTLSISLDKGRHMSKPKKKTELQLANDTIEAMRRTQTRLADTLTESENMLIETREKLTIEVHRSAKMGLELRNARTDRAILIRSVHFLTTGEALKSDAAIDG